MQIKLSNSVKLSNHQAKGRMFENKKLSNK